MYIAIEVSSPYLMYGMKLKRVHACVVLPEFEGCTWQLPSMSTVMFGMYFTRWTFLLVQVVSHTQLT